MSLPSNSRARRVATRVLVVTLFCSASDPISSFATPSRDAGRGLGLLRNFGDARVYAERDLERRPRRSLRQGTERPHSDRSYLCGDAWLQNVLAGRSSCEAKSIQGVGIRPCAPLHPRTLTWRLPKGRTSAVRHRGSFVARLPVALGQLCLSTPSCAGQQAVTLQEWHNTSRVSTAARSTAPSIKRA